MATTTWTAQSAGPSIEFPDSSLTRPEWAEYLVEEHALRVTACHELRKEPLSLDWPARATHDARRVARLFGTPARARRNVAVVTGETADGEWHFVLDVDVKHGARGRSSLARLVDEHGWLPETLTTHTPSGGLHFHFRSPRPVPTSRGKLGDGLEVLGVSREGRGCLVLAPSSELPHGTYRADDRAELAEAPAWLLKLAQRAAPCRRRKAPRGATAPASPALWEAVVDAAVRRLRRAVPGERHAALVSGAAFCASRAKAHGFEVETAFEALAACFVAVKPDAAEDELEGAFRWALEHAEPECSPSHRAAA